MRIVILGGGPCGLGAAWRLAELGHPDWSLYEKMSQWGGLSTSYQDDEGFTWDLGGHVLFSHYDYFDRVMNRVFGNSDGWLSHEREAWVRMLNRFIPYPIQNNIHRLPKAIFWECLQGILDIQDDQRSRPPADFEEWIYSFFGKGLAKWFLKPYNFKVWAWPPEQMEWSWVGERVAPVNLKRVLENAVFDKDEITWGPNSRFRFPLHGGTGAIWKSLAEKLPGEKMHLNRKVAGLEVSNRKVYFPDNTKEDYDALISTIPLTDLVRLADLDPPFDRVPELKYSSTHIAGLALKGNPPEHLANKCWMYFPEDNCPFYRATVFSHYSPNNVPDVERHWSLMFEVSESPEKPVNPDTVMEDVIDGAINTGLLENRSQVHHTWYHFIPFGYPTPSRNRNEQLFPHLVGLAKQGIFSRGRFGAWRYEVGNMDHAFMQGVECVNSLLGSGEELTLWYPNVVNSPHPSGEKR